MPRRKTYKEFKAEFEKMFGDEYILLSKEYINGKTKVKVQHKKCGFIFYPTPNNLLTGKSSCPKCANNIKLSDAEFREKVFKKYGDEYKVLSEYNGLKKNVKVRHKCGNEFTVTADGLLYRNPAGGCKKCSHKKSSEKLRKSINEFKTKVYNCVKDEYSVLSTSYTNQLTKVLMKHNDPKCKCKGVPFYVTPKNFLHKEVRCPCKRSKGEDRIAEFLDKNSIKYDGNASIEGCKDKIKLRFDFKIYNFDKSKFALIEYDGEQHFKSSKNWGGKKALLERQQKDKIKNEFCEKNNLPLLRIKYTDKDKIPDILSDFIRKENLMVYDTIIIGAGPAGLTAGIYMLRAGKNILVLERNIYGGQAADSPRIENYPGFSSISGIQLSEEMFRQFQTLGGKLAFEEVESISRSEKLFLVKTDLTTSMYLCKSVIIASGCSHRKLGILNEDKFIGKGISYCATCDGAFYRDKNVVVIGDGNSAIQYAISLSDICKSVKICSIFDHLSAEKTLQKQAITKENIEILYNLSAIKFLDGDIFRGIEFLDRKNSCSKTIECDGCFVAIGQKPDNERFASVIPLEKSGFIITDNSLRTIDGIFAAGDCREKSVRQIATAVGDGAQAAIECQRYLQNE